MCVQSYTMEVIMEGMIEGTIIEPSDDMYVVLVQFDGGSPWWNCSLATRKESEAAVEHERLSSVPGNRVFLVHAKVPHA